jgi:leucyl-tRNA synthetase
MKSYDHKKIESKLLKEWQAKKIYEAKNVSKQKKCYVLDMFPYPSGAGLHVGHPRGYIGSDVYARMKRMQGFNVLHPMGFDAFGLPAEQYAIQTGKHPSIITKSAIKNFKSQLSKIGFSYDWSREVQTIDPGYYKWTQWIFLKIYNSFFDTVKQKARPIDELVAMFEKSGNAKANETTWHGDVHTFTAKEWKAYSEKEKQDILMAYRMAYEGYAEVNWCKELGTVLANDEVVDKEGKLVSERGEFPVEKKSMRQWFMRISAYGDRLIDGLNEVDFAESTKEIQRNWIGKSEGSEISFELSTGDAIRVFTTRADTLFGVTYIVLAPEHALVSSLKSQVANKAEVEKFLESVKSKTQEERTDAKEKSGVALEGVYATNPANGERVPVWIADYVLAGYGTGAVMAVPAHDERDFEFAKKYNLPIKRVIEPVFYSSDSPLREGLPIIKRDAVCAIIRNPKDDSYLCSVWRDMHMNGLITGGIEEGEDIVEGALREIYEETGYKNLKFVADPDVAIHSFFFHRKKEVNRCARFQYLFFDLIDATQDPIDEKEAAIHDLVWKKRDELDNFFSVIEGQYLLELIDKKECAMTDTGILTHSEKFDGMESAEARIAITKAVGGKLVTKYKMRDAIFARQRYWGEPIPLIHDKKTGLIREVPLSKLPLKLPNVKSYKPTGTGESPLAGVASWVKAGYDTNTMPGWAGSSWYFLRYMDPKNSKALASTGALKYWRDVDMYVGGTEHNTGHLLYARFWHKVLYDLGIVPTNEPFRALRHQGMIGGSDGRKMSKRWGNVVNPDDVVATYGADSLRVFEMFLGPFDAHLPWSTDGIVGSRRFVEKVWKMGEKVKSQKANATSDTNIQKTLHKTIKKVSEDIASFNFNTAISAMMICINEMEKGQVAKSDFIKFLQVLAPFASFVTEELWSELGEKGSIHTSPWPKYNPKLIVDDEITMGIQINGKVRDEVTIPKDATELEVKTIVLAREKVREWIAGKEIKKFIYVPGRIISVVAP